MNVCPVCSCSIDALNSITEMLLNQVCPILVAALFSSTCGVPHLLNLLSTTEFFISDFRWHRRLSSENRFLGMGLLLFTFSKAFIV